MEKNYEMLANKILDFWKSFDNKVITKKDLLDVFTSYELSTILCDLSFIRSYSLSVKPFREKIINDLRVDNDNSISLFDKDNIKNLANISITNPLDLTLVFLFSSDEVLLSLLSDSSFEEYYDMIINNIKMDDSRIKAISIINDKYLKSNNISQIKDDNLKLKYLNKVLRSEKVNVIASLKSDELKLKYINFFTKNKGIIISSLSSDELKISLINKYHLVKDDLNKVIVTFKNEENIIKYFSYLNDEYIIDLFDSYRSKDFIKKILSIIQINDNNYLEIFKVLNESYEDLVLDFYNRLSLNQKENLFDDYKEYIKPSLLFSMYKTLEDRSVMYDYIGDDNPLPEYIDDYEYLINEYAYSVNYDREDKERFKKHFLFFVKNYSLELYRYLDNSNIKKILYSSDEDFYKLMSLFDKDKLVLNEDNLNDILNAYLQRLFKKNNVEVLSIYQSMLNYINSNDIDSLLKVLDDISKNVNINEMISKRKYNFNEFVDLLINKDQLALDILNNISYEYITIMRNNFVKDNYEEFLSRVTQRKFNKKSLMKYMIKNYPSELIVKYFDGSLIDISSVDFSDNELKLLKDIDSIKKIIDFRKNPKAYMVDGVVKPDIDISRNMIAFDSLFNKIVSNLPCSFFPDINVSKDGFIPESLGGRAICELLKNINIDTLKLDLFSNDELFSNFKDFWYKYKIGAWNSELCNLSNTIGVEVSPEVIATIMECYGLISKNDDLSLLKMFDTAHCLGSNSSKYSLLFGSYDYYLIVSDPGPNQSFKLTKEQRIKESMDYLKIMMSKKYITIPSIDSDFELENGKKVNVVLGNFTNMMNLTYGQRTHSCYRFGSHAESLLKYTLENENGFSIRFSDPKTGELIGRIAGFRNGNTVFLNTIYMVNNNEYSYGDICSICKMVSELIIEKTKDSLVKIDNVFMVENDNIASLHMFPIVKTKKLKPCYKIRELYTDYKRSENAVILATSSKEKPYEKMNLGLEETPRYSVVRDKINSYNGYQAIDRVCQLQIIDQLLSGKKIDSIDVNRDETINYCISGEDWCLYIDDNNVLHRFVMQNSKNKVVALEEMKSYVGFFSSMFQITSYPSELVL